MIYITEVQKVVVEKRIKDGYELLGKTVSTTNGLASFVLNKGRHLVVINSLGYDEHFHGKTWNVN